MGVAFIVIEEVDVAVIGVDAMGIGTVDVWAIGVADWLSGILVQSASNSTIDLFCNEIFFTEEVDHYKE